MVSAASPAIIKPTGASRFSDEQAAVIVICLAMLLAGCGGSLRGNASAGPSPGGGFYSASNIDNGRVNP